MRKYQIVTYGINNPEAYPIERNIPECYKIYIDADENSLTDFTACATVSAYNEADAIERFNVNLRKILKKTRKELK